MRSFEASGAEVRRNRTALRAHRFLLRAGLALGNVFAWIFVFEYFLSLSDSIPRSLGGVLLMYGLSQAITILITPLAAAHLRRGTRSALLWAVILVGSAFVILGATFEGFFVEQQTLSGIAIFAILLGAYRALYFTPYELSRKDTEKGISRGYIFWEILLALLPAFVGATLIMEPYAPLRLLFGAAALVGISILPLLMLSNIRERFLFSYTETFHELFLPRNYRLVWLSFLDGMQGAALFLIWPLAVFLIVGFSYAMLGIIFTVTLLSILLFRIVFRRLLSSTREFSTPVHVVLAVSGWIARLAAGTPIGIIIADSYAYTTRKERGTLLDPFVFEQASDNGSFVDEHTVLKEIALAGGRIAFVTVVGFFVFSAPLTIAFGVALVLAALAAGISVLLAQKSQGAAY